MWDVLILSPSRLPVPPLRPMLRGSIYQLHEHFKGKSYRIIEGLTPLMQFLISNFQFRIILGMGAMRMER
jgi:hypothetical protein